MSRPLTLFAWSKVGIHLFPSTYNPCSALVHSSIKAVSEAKRSERAVFLYVHQNSDDFMLVFPSQAHRHRFLQLIEEITADQTCAATKILNAEVSWLFLHVGLNVNVNVNVGVVQSNQLINFADNARP